MRDAALLRLTRAGLTRREREVAALVAEGLSNQAIADRLVIGVETVKSHLRSAYGKTGAQGRAGLAALWARHEEAA